MTYFQFVLLFLAIPIAFLAIMARKSLTKTNAILIGVLMLVALAYTTPWDNYLVASRVWWYDPALVTGLTIGWVPIEEYTFIGLQPILAGLIALLVGRLFQDQPYDVDRKIVRVMSTIVLAALWISAVVVLLAEWMPGNYLALILVWAIPPIALQSAYGADLLLLHWRRVLTSILVPVLYLSWADSLAIQSGTWTINPSRTLGIHFGNVLPLEEFIFFVVTNMLLVFSVILVQSASGERRFQRFRSTLQQDWLAKLTRTASAE